MGQQVAEDTLAEKINAHRGEVGPAVGRRPEAREDVLVNPHPFDVAGSPGFSRNSVMRPRLLTFMTRIHKRARPDGRHRDADLGARSDMEVDELPIVHPIEVVPERTRTSAPASSMKSRF